MRKGMIFWGVTFLLITTFTLGCASRREIVRFKTQLDYLEKSNWRLEENAADLDSLLKEQLKETQRMRADINSSFGSMDERLKIVEGWLSDSDSRFNELLKKIEQKREETWTEFDSTKGDTTKPSVDFDPQNLYDAAYLNVIKGNYDLAILGFGDYVNYFPRTALAPTAQYWIAECYYTKKDFQKASEEFEKLFQNYPASEKTPSALYKLGLIYRELDKEIEANGYFGQLLDKYPQSPEAKLAQEWMGIKD